MKKIFIAYLMLVLGISCAAKQPAENFNTTNTTLHPSQSDTKEITKLATPKKKHEDAVVAEYPKLKAQQNTLYKGRLSGSKSKAEICIERMDPGIELIYVTEQWAKERGFLDPYKADPGFDKWCIFFHEIPGNPPYAYEEKRVAQRILERFYPYGGAKSKDILECKNSNLPAILMVSTRGYLLGEKITIRLSGTDAHKEITFYPRPLLLKNADGEFLGKAGLLCGIPKHVLYEFDISEVGEEEKYKFSSRSAHETLSHNHVGPVSGSMCPEVLGEDSGVAKIVVRLEDGSDYTMQLPWGYTLFEYAIGAK